MIKQVLFLSFFSFTTSFSFSQLISGDLIDSGRKMTSKFNFEIAGTYTGYQLFELSVNPEGKVTSVKESYEKGALISSPAKILASNQLLDLKFEAASHYPKFHHVKVKVKFVKSMN
jgi:hypothetical protein